MNSGGKKIFKKIVVVVSITLGIFLTGGFIFTMFLFNAMGLFDRSYDKEALVENFNKRQAEIYDLKSYFNQIVPKYKKIAIEFDGDNEIARFDIYPVDTGKWSNLAGTTEWNVPVKSAKADSLLTLAGLNRDQLKTLKQKLDAANCISISSGEPSKIAFKRSGMGMYSFTVFDKPMTDSVRKQYIADSCTYIYINNRLALEYGGGAIGPQCFPRSDYSPKAK